MGTNYELYFMGRIAAIKSANNLMGLYWGIAVIKWNFWFLVVEQTTKSYKASKMLNSNLCNLNYTGLSKHWKYYIS